MDERSMVGYRSELVVNHGQHNERLIETRRYRTLASWKNITARCNEIKDLPDAVLALQPELDAEFPDTYAVRVPSRYLFQSVIATK